MLKKKKSHQKDPNSVFEALSRSSDFINELSSSGGFLYRISFFRSLINGNLLHEQILPFIQQLHLTPSLEELKEHIPTSILHHVEKEVEKRVAQQGRDLVQSFKKQKIDPLGLGLRYRSKDTAMTPEKWQKIYPDTDVQVNCHMNIVQTGVSQ